MTDPGNATIDSHETLRARARDRAVPNADGVLILANYQRRDDGYLLIPRSGSSTANSAVTSVLRHCDWATLVRNEGWLIPAAKLKSATLALRGADVTLIDAQDRLAGYDTVQPPDARDTVLAPLPECAECGAPYPRDAAAGDGENCWQCTAPLRLVRPRLL